MASRNTRNTNNTRNAPSTLALHLAGGLTALALLAGPTLAETYSVSPNGALPTIQAGIDAAGPGDTVAVKAGTYLENVTIPGGKNGLQLIGKGKVVLDARPLGQVGSGPGLIVESADVTVRGLSIRHAAAGQVLAGYGIYANASGLTVAKTTIQHCDGGGVWGQAANSMTVSGSTISGCSGPAVHIDGGYVRIEKNSIRGCEDGIVGLAPGGSLISNTIASIDGPGISLDGEALEVSRNVIERCDGEGIELMGESCLVERNTVKTTRHAGITIKGPGARVLRNRISHVDGIGVEVSGEGSRVISNRLEGLADVGISSDGLDAVIDRNTISDATGEGIEHTGGLVMVTRNTLRGIGGQKDGIHLFATFDGKVSDNRLADVAGNGIRVHDGSSSMVITGNRVDDAGDNDRDGILVEGQGHEVSGNRVTGAGRDGIHAEGEAVLIEGNTVTAAGEDGIDLDSGVNSSLLDNKVVGCLAEGIENSGFNTLVEGNVSKGNRADFANDNDMASFAGNQSGDGTHLEADKPSIDS